MAVCICRPWKLLWVMKSVKFNSCLRTIHQIFEYTSLSRMLLEMRIRRYEQEFAVLLSFGSLLILCFDYFNTDWIAFHRDLPSQFHYCHSTLHVPSSPFPFCPFTSYNGSTSTQCFSFGISTSSVNRRCWKSRRRSKCSQTRRGTIQWTTTSFNRRRPT